MQFCREAWSEFELELTVGKVYSVNKAVSSANFQLSLNCPSSRGSLRSAEIEISECVPVLHNILNNVSCTVKYELIVSFSLLILEV